MPINALLDDYFEEVSFPADTSMEPLQLRIIGPSHNNIISQDLIVYKRWYIAVISKYNL